LPDVVREVCLTEIAVDVRAPDQAHAGGEPVTD
jgi:hypothetical protein